MTPAAKNLCAFLFFLMLAACQAGTATVAPRVVGTSPSDGHVDVAVDGNLQATFPTPVAPESTRGLFSLTHDHTPVAGVLDIRGADLTFTPSVRLPRGTTFVAKIAAGVQSLSGGARAEEYAWRFTTVAATPEERLQV